MQREIKFRYWLGHTKKMTFGHTLEETLNIIPAFTKDIIPLQYTGLKDKNNKDIYDLDHLKDDNDNIGKVIWGDHGWLVEFETETMDLTETEHWAIVTGNVFENQ